jgi:hypothetical protein
MPCKSAAIVRVGKDVTTDVCLLRKMQYSDSSSWEKSVHREANKKAYRANWSVCGVWAGQVGKNENGKEIPATPYAPGIFGG